MISKLQKFYLLPLLIISFLLNSGCGTFNPPHKDSQGFYTAHYSSCGPDAVHEALTRYCEINGIKFKKELSKVQISRDIQRNAPPFIFNKRKLLIIFDREAAEITWPNEIKTACQKYGVKLTKVDPSVLLNDSDKNDTYIVLVHKSWTINTYHWYAYPGTTPAHFWKERTVFDIVYKLEPLQK